MTSPLIFILHTISQERIKIVYQMFMVVFILNGTKKNHLDLQFVVLMGCLWDELNSQLQMMSVAVAVLHSKHHSHLKPEQRPLHKHLDSCNAVTTNLRTHICNVIHTTEKYTFISIKYLASFKHTCSSLSLLFQETGEIWGGYRTQVIMQSKTQVISV